MNGFPRYWGTTAIGCVSFALISGAGSVGAEEKSGGDLRAATQNPISSMCSLPFKFTFDNGAPDWTIGGTIQFLFPR